MSPLRVGVVCPYDLSVPGGVQAQVLGLARYLESQGDVAVVIGPGLPEHVNGVDLGRSLSVPGNGSMVAIACDSQDKVRALYEKALALGGKDEGPPGTRFGNFFAAYFRDPDGNKLNAFHMG